MSGLATFPLASALNFFEASPLDFKLLEALQSLYQEIRIQAAVYRRGFLPYGWVFPVNDSVYLSAKTTTTFSTGERAVLTAALDINSIEGTRNRPSNEPLDVVFTPSPGSYATASLAWRNGFYNGSPVTPVITVQETESSRTYSAADANTPDVILLTQKCELSRFRSLDEWIAQLLSNLASVDLDDYSLDTLVGIAPNGAVQVNLSWTFAGLAYVSSIIGGPSDFGTDAALFHQVTLDNSTVPTEIVDVFGLTGGDYYPGLISFDGLGGSTAHDAETYYGADLDGVGLLGPRAQGAGYVVTTMHASKCRHKISGVCLTLDAAQSQRVAPLPDHIYGMVNYGTPQHQGFSAQPPGLTFDTLCPAQSVQDFLAHYKRQFWRWSVWSNLQTSTPDAIPAICYS